MSRRYADQAVPDERLHGLVEFVHRHERRLALRAQHVLDHRGAQQLDLIGGGAAIRVLEGHDLALLGDAELAAIDPAGAAAMARPVGAPPAAHRSASTVKESDRDPMLASQPRQLTLRLRQLPMRGQIAAVLVRVGIADHHLLDVSPAHRGSAVPEAPRATPSRWRARGAGPGWSRAAARWAAYSARRPRHRRTVPPPWRGDTPREYRRRYESC